MVASLPQNGTGIGVQQKYELEDALFSTSTDLKPPHVWSNTIPYLSGVPFLTILAFCLVTTMKGKGHKPTFQAQRRHDQRISEHAVRCLVLAPACTVCSRGCFSIGQILHLWCHMHATAHPCMIVRDESLQPSGACCSVIHAYHHSLFHVLLSLIVYDFRCDVAQLKATKRQKSPRRVPNRSHRVWCGQN
jgi:hypothetical protein